MASRELSQAASGADGEWFNPFNRDRFVPVDPLIVEWARALCIDYGAKPDEMIGLPEYPRWRSWVGYAENASRAAIALGYSRGPSAQDTSERSDPLREESQ